MLNYLRRKTKEFGKSTSGNATLLVALGMPVLIGGAGLGTDLAQWYMWKRELQFAVDQAAIAGAWAMTDVETESTYVTRATQEFNANLSATDDFAASPTIQLANFAGGTQNSVAVTATATRALPFSSFLTGESATIWAYAQASFEEGTTFTSCLIAVDEDDYGAITVGGSSVLTASCGMAALSTDETAIAVDGNPTVDAGWIIARGGVDDWFYENTDDIILEGVEGLYDPFETLSPPEPTESQVAREYTCSNATPETTADVRTTVYTTYEYYQGANTRNADLISYDSPKDPSTVVTDEDDKLVPEETQEGTFYSESESWTYISGSGSRTYISGSGSNRIYEKRITNITEEITDLQIKAGTVQGDVVPGTYSSIFVACDTTFSPGVYIIDGGGVNITGQYEVTGSNIMFVLKNGAYIKIRGGTNINLTAIQASDLIARGIDPVVANELAGMLVFEDPTSEGSLLNDINGNADTILNGTIYLPNSPISFAGTATVTTQCLMIAAKNIIITGTTNMTTFCPDGSSEDTEVATIAGTVRLVA